MMLASLLSARLLRPIDVQAGRLAARLDPERGPQLAVCTAFASRATGQGHTCLPLSCLAAQLAEAGTADPVPDDSDALRALLLASPLVGRPGEHRPLILDRQDRLYLLRYFAYEQEIARGLRQRAQGLDTAADADRTAALLDRLFGPAAGTTDWQRLAAALALRKRLVVISGGPGTGKTYTVARILALFGVLGPDRMRIALAAPTGKAALRLTQSIRGAQATLPPDLAQALPDQAQTLHRLLGFQAHRPGFVHHRANPLHLDLLILDEASMIDVPLMAAVVAALPARCRLILLGDRDQLASVEAGNLFADLSTGELDWSAELQSSLGRLGGLADASPAPDRPEVLADSLILLRTSRRFHADSGIGSLARAVNSGDPSQLAPLVGGLPGDLALVDPETVPSDWLRQQFAQWFAPLFAAGSPAAALALLAACRVLCALREGPRGVTGINQLAEAALRHQGWVRPGEQLYRGMPVLIERNDYGLQLFNGDTGVLWPDDQGRLAAWFSQEGDTVRPVPLLSLPAWQPSFGLTVHKAQGSEFERVLLVLPGDDSPVLTRELLYTGITRAKTRLTVFGRTELLARAIQRRAVRHSGLRDQLRRELPWGPECPPAPLS